MKKLRVAPLPSKVVRVVAKISPPTLSRTRAPAGALTVASSIARANHGTTPAPTVSLGHAAVSQSGTHGPFQHHRLSGSRGLGAGGPARDCLAADWAILLACRPPVCQLVEGWHQLGALSAAPVDA